MPLRTIRPGTFGKASFEVEMTGVYRDPEETKKFFQSLISRGLEKTLPGPDEAIETYLTEMLLSHLHSDPTPSLSQFLITQRPILLVRQGLSLPTPVLKQARETHKHIADTLLFWLGLFPEHLKRSQERGELLSLISPVPMGKSCYRIVSLVEEQVAPENAPLFRKLSHLFEKYVLTLRYVKKDLIGNA